MKRFSDPEWQDAIHFQRGAILAAERQREVAKSKLLSPDSSQAIASLALMTGARKEVQSWSVYKSASVMQSIKRRNPRLIARALGEAKAAERSHATTIARTFGVPDIKES